jgi:predicted XRE-type DNA-binding protein
MSKQDDLFIEEGSGNVFADLGFADPDTHLLKAQLVTRVAEAMQARKMTQIAAAKATGSTQPEMSRILRGQFRSVSVERLLAMLTRLGCEVDIVVRPQGRPTESAVIHFAESAAA